MSQTNKAPDEAANSFSCAVSERMFERLQKSNHIVVTDHARMGGMSEFDVYVSLAIRPFHADQDGNVWVTDDEYECETCGSSVSVADYSHRTHVGYDAPTIRCEDCERGMVRVK